MYNRKGISPVIATALIMVVAVVAVVGFQGWFGAFSSNLFTKTEQQSSGSVENTQIDDVIGYTLYFKNGKTANISINKIKVDSTDCNISGNYSPGISVIDLGTCLDNLYTNSPEVTVYTDSGVYSEKIYLKDLVVRVYAGCSLDGSDATHLGSNLFYNSSSLPFDGNCTLSRISRNCFDGTYSGNSSFQFGSCSLVGQDITPAAFNFTNQTGVNLSTIITSNTLTPTGYEGSVSVGISGNGTPKLSVAGGAWTSSTTITAGQNITIRLNSSSQSLNTSIATLILGNYSVNWSVITKDFNCYLNGSTIIHGQNITAFSLPLSTLNCLNQTRTCNDGNLNGSISYKFTSCNSNLYPNVGGIWVLVFGNSNTYINTSDFYIMRYEARNNNNLPNSTPNGVPWVSINYTNAQANCSVLGNKYHLITNSEWVTVSRDGENISLNWASGTVNSGEFVRGYSASSWGDGTWTTSAGASSSLDTCLYQTGGASCDTTGIFKYRRTLYLSSNESIWDLGGNYREMTNTTCTSGSGIGNFSSMTNIIWNNAALTDYETLSSGPVIVQNSDMMGDYNGCTTTGDVIVRGPDFGSCMNDMGSIFCFSVYPKTATGSEKTFRCTYTP